MIDTSTDATAVLDILADTEQLKDYANFCRPASERVQLEQLVVKWVRCFSKYTRLLTKYKSWVSSTAAKPSNQTGMIHERATN